MKKYKKIENLFKVDHDENFVMTPEQARRHIQKKLDRYFVNDQCVKQCETFLEKSH